MRTSWAASRGGWGPATCPTRAWRRGRARQPGAACVRPARQPPEPAPVQPPRPPPPRPRRARSLVNAAESSAAARKERLEGELHGSKSNLIKESIRLGHNDLGDFHYARGDLQARGGGGGGGGGAGSAPAPGGRARGRLHPRRKRWDAAGRGASSRRTLPPTPARPAPPPPSPAGRVQVLRAHARLLHDAAPRARDVPQRHPLRRGDGQLPARGQLREQGGGRARGLGARGARRAREARHEGGGRRCPARRVQRRCPFC